MARTSRNGRCTNDGLEAKSIAVDDPLKMNTLGSQMDGAVQDNSDHGFDEHFARRKLPHAHGGQQLFKRLRRKQAEGVDLAQKIPAKMHI